MSFILDALKKSETDRQRQNGPALFEVRVAPPRNSLPVWAIGLGVLLAVNLVIVAWVLLRHSSSADPQAAAAPAGSQAQSYAPGGSGQAQGQYSQPQTAPVSGTAPIAPLGQTAGLTQGMQPSPAMAGNQPQYANGGGQGQYGNTAQYANAGQAAGGNGNASNGPGSSGPFNRQSGNGQSGNGQSGNGQSGNGQAGNGQADNGNPAPSYPQQGAPQPSLNGPAPNQPNPGSAGANPDDLAPAADPGPPQPFGNHVTRSTNSGVPLYQDAALNSHLPTLRLDLHVFAAKPQERFVMINMHKLHEGDTLPSEGVRVENITPEGAILSHDGAKFLLPRD